ncbi:YraN family protein [Maridesulfovibrio hydrothermalis]|uniref:YraN family protein n=1 Tax=Maridesulfovibrio hydrothermalis TaxID=191026 RepID=UPI0002D66F58|nr:YraN family protein [Maridesulfovibrio hydrothermalis]
MSPRHVDFGHAGEDYAACYLENRGYNLRQRNWRWRQWELDIICELDDELIFVEVKTRTGRNVQSGVQAVNAAKQRKLVKAATHYLSAMDLWHRPCRFDLVIVNDDGNGFTAEHIQNAFDLTDIMGGGNTAWQPW